MRALDALGIAYEVVPGVSSFVAAAAALPSELTLPGVSQTVIITRQPGRTPVPPGQDVSSLAAHRATMAVFLSAGRLEETVAALREHYPGETAAAIVQRASWPQQKVLRGTLSTIEAAARQAGIDRTAMILVGDVLRNEGEASLLYDRSFSHRYRQGEIGLAGAVSTSQRRIVGRVVITVARPGACAIVAVSDDGARLGAVLAKRFAEPERVTVWAAQPYVPGVRIYDRSLTEHVGVLWRGHAAIVGVMASGIMVRVIAPWLQSKLSDPGVVVLDDAGRFAISLLAGHEGGAIAWPNRSQPRCAVKRS